jgi:protein SCO1/2
VLCLNFHSESNSAGGWSRWMVMLSVAGVLGLTACARERGELPAVLEGIPLTDQNGNTVGAAELGGKPLLVNFMFTRCSVVCGRQTQALEDARAALPEAVRNRVRFLSVSVDPANDDATALKRFAGRHGADVPGWSFVRSDELNTQQLTLRMAAFEPGTGARPPPSAHTLGLYLFDREGRLVQRYAGSPIDVPRISRELVALDDLNTSEARLASR